MHILKGPTSTVVTFWSLIFEKGIFKSLVKSYGTWIFVQSRYKPPKKKNASNGLESRFTSIACKNMNYEFLFQAVKKIAIRRIFDWSN
jgi:hypothetical protein